MKKVLILALLSASLSAFAADEPIVVGHQQTQIAFYDLRAETPDWVNPGTEIKDSTVLSTPNYSAYIEMSLKNIRDYVNSGNTIHSLDFVLKGLYPVSDLKVYLIQNFEDMTGVALTDRASMVRGEEIGTMNSISSDEETSLDVKDTITSAIATEAAYIAFELATPTPDAMNALRSLDNSMELRVNAAVPEPSTYAAILGALALGFVAYRKRK